MHESIDCDIPYVVQIAARKRDMLTQVLLRLLQCLQEKDLYNISQQSPIAFFHVSALQFHILPSALVKQCRRIIAVSSDRKVSQSHISEYAISIIKVCFTRKHSLRLYCCNLKICILVTKVWLASITFLLKPPKEPCPSKKHPEVHRMHITPCSYREHDDTYL